MFTDYRQRFENQYTYKSTENIKTQLGCDRLNTNKNIYKLII